MRAKATELADELEGGVGVAQHLAGEVDPDVEVVHVEAVVHGIEQVAVPEPTNTSRNAAANAGRKSTGAASAATTAQSQSILSGLFSAFGG